MTREEKELLTNKLIDLNLISKASEIEENSYIELEKIYKGVKIEKAQIDQFSKHLFGIHQKDRYETVLYYKFLLSYNFSSLIADIDKHAEYNLPQYYIKIHNVFDVFYRIELTAKFINFAETLGAIYTVTQEWKKAFSDKIFESEVKKLVDSLSLNFQIIKKIRNKLHHAYYVRINKSSVRSATENYDLICFDRSELLRKIDKFTADEIIQLDKYHKASFIDIKPLVVDTFKEYSVFFDKYQILVKALLARLTGTSYTFTL